MQDIFKLKELVVRSIVELDIDTVKLNSVKAVVRWDDELDNGL